MRSYTAQKMKFYIKDLFSKFDQIRKKLRLWSHLLKKFLIENFSFLCSVWWLKCLLITFAIKFLFSPERFVATFL